ncbi:MAG: hypothetical protein LBV02_04715 [Bacteroidales bacterium]|jgi:hypothetical protein|nr:hypothetical protein [Bacteroidales bacterium]
MMKKEESPELKNKIKLPSLAFVTCLVMAAAIWLFTTLSKEYTMTLEYQVSCKDLPASKQLVALSDSVVNLTFTTRGFNFLGPKYSDSHRQINLSLTTLTQNSSKRNVYTFNRRVLTEYIRTQPGIDAAFMEVETPESITVYLR